MTVPLQPVSLKKGPLPTQPRLSPKYIAGAPRHQRFWTAEEDALIREAYPSGGIAKCMIVLPARTLSDLRNRVVTLKLRYSGDDNGGRRDLTAILTPTMEAQIREAFPSMHSKGATVDLAKRLQVPRTWLSDVMLKLDLIVPLKTKEPKWSEAEDALMLKVPLHDPKRASRVFRSYGFKRTPIAIVVRAKRLNLKRRYTETLSAGRAAAILGIDSKVIAARCLSGEIKAGRRGSQRLSQQGGDAWSIERRDLRQWVIDHLENVDLRKVDKFAFVELLVGATPASKGAADVP